MSGLKEKILAETKTAMKGIDALRLSTLRMLASALHNREIAKRTKLVKEKSDLAEKDWQLAEEETIAAVQSEVKKRKEAAGQYQKGGRPELVQKEEAEIKILSEFLPPQLSEAEIESKVKAVVERLTLSGQLNQGKIMKEVMAEIGARADGVVVAKLVGQILSQR